MVRHWDPDCFLIGDWDAQAEQFVPETDGRMNWRRDEQSSQGHHRGASISSRPKACWTPDGRRVMWAWLATIGNTPVRWSTG